MTNISTGHLFLLLRQGRNDTVLRLTSLMTSLYVKQIPWPVARDCRD